MNRFIDWIFPKDIWKDFYLDNIIFVKSEYRPEFDGYLELWVFREFWEQIKIYELPDQEEQGS